MRKTLTRTKITKLIKGIRRSINITEYKNITKSIEKEPGGDSCWGYHQLFQVGGLNRGRVEGV